LAVMEVLVEQVAHLVEVWVETEVPEGALN